MSRERGRLAARLAGALLVALALGLPSEAWLTGLRGPVPAGAGRAPELLAGAALWRIALALLGAYVGVRFGLASAPQARAQRAEGERRLGPRQESPPQARAQRAEGERSREGGARAARAAGTSASAGLALAAILVFATAVRLVALDAGLWLDEVLTLTQYVRLPLGTLLTTLDSENQHFAFTVPAHLSVALFGESAWALRLPSVLYGVASIGALWLVGRALADRREALLAAALLAVSYHHVWFSQNARGYTAALLFALLATWLFLRARDTNRPGLWVAYAACAAAGAWSHLTAVFVAFGHFALFLPRLARRDAPWGARLAPLVDGFGLAALLTFALYSFGLPQFFGSALEEPSVVDTWKDPLWTLRETLAGLGRAGGGALLGAAALGGLGVGAVSFARRGRPEPAVLFAVPALGIAAAALGLGHHLWPRSFFVLAGFAVLLAVRGLLAGAEWAAARVGLAAPTARRLATAAALLAALASAATLPRAWVPKQDYAGARAFVEAQRESDEPVVTVGLARYPYGRIYAPDWRVAESPAALQALRTPGTRTWVVYTFPQHMAAEHPDLLALLERDFRLERRFDASVGDGAIFVLSDAVGDDVASSPPSSPE